MSVKTYLVQFKSSGMIAQLVVATSVEIEGDQLVMRDSQGEMVASSQLISLKAGPRLINMTAMRDRPRLNLLQD
jgi:hypothetical protein